MSAEFPKNEPVQETAADKIAKLKAEIAALEAAEAAAPAAEAQAEVPTAPVQEQPIETAATPDPAIVEQQAQQSAADTAALEATKERLGMPVESAGFDGPIKDNETYKKLVAAFTESHMSVGVNAEAIERTRKYSNELVGQLNNISDIKEAVHYLSNEAGELARKKWDELSANEVESAQSEEEIKNAFDNIRSGGYATPIALRKQANSKYFKITGKRVDPHYSITYL